MEKALTLEEYKNLMVNATKPLTDYNMTYWVKRYEPEDEFSLAHLSDALSWDDQEV